MALTFRKFNDVYLKFEGDKGDMRSLSDYFTFKVPGAEFSPAYRNKFWDGKIRLANLKDFTIYAGLWEEIAKFSRDLNVDVYMEGNKYDFPGREQPVEDEFLDGFLDALDPHSKGQSIEIRDYQREAFKTGVRKQRGLLLSPTASGKSLIIYSLMRWWREVHDRKILIVVPTISLVGQMIGDFYDYSNGKFDDVAGITGGSNKNPDARVVVSTWQSIHNQPASWFAQFGSLIVDEVHHAQSKSIQKIMNKMMICPDRIGLTGTIQDAKTHELVLKGLFGPVTKMITTKELMDRDQISDMKIQMLRFDYNEADKKAVSKLKYQEEIDFLLTHDKRNKVVSRLAATLEGNTLVIFSRLDHGKMIHGLIETDKQLHYIAGETEKDQREIIRQMAENNDVIIVASMGVFSTGVNIKNLHNLIFAHPTKSKIKVLQSIGRVLRKADDGKPATVYDIVDDLKHGMRENFALKHASERFKFYTNEKFDFKINNIPL